MIKKQKDLKSKHKKIAFAASAFIVLLFIDLFFTGFLKFGLYSLNCGQMPVKVIPGAFAGPTTYELPGNYYPGWANSEYLCTEQEAINKNLTKGINTRYSEFKNR